ncbi:amidohydrolase family protein [Rhodococcus sp. T2V]|uniref:amidohydrolase family protein n=1 Tax=Rhodococcus sp. T2V TaxID=3034164 RepID=UPI0023E128D6|nr:amidohydrolase family protein [Rhodococcus sp. T2V]MDF3312821.1 amidohydrolase family protein [Rhodococcus sp. T2V]
MATLNNRPILLQGGLVVSMDPRVGNLRGDVLIANGKIVAVAQSLSELATDHAVVVDATGTIVMPGLVESHVHAWQGQLRGIAPAIDFGTYLDLIHHGLAHHYRPHDVYVGNFVTSLQALDGGVTTILDNSHNSRTPDHSNAAVEALRDTGIRAVHACGAAISGTTANAWPGDVLRLRDEYFSSEDQLLTLRLFDAYPDARAWQFAKDNDLWISHEMGGGGYVDNLPEMHAAGLLTDRHTFNHCFGTEDADWKLIADSGAQVNLNARSDAHFGLGPAHAPLTEAKKHGIRPGLSMDNEISYGLDMFVEMQTLLGLTRARTFEHNLSNPDSPIEQITIGEMLEYATLGGAANCNLDNKIGSLTPGKEADVILVRTTDFNTAPTNNVYATLVGFANRCNVDSVFVAGEVKKWNGHLVDHDLSALEAVSHASREHLFAAHGVAANVFSEYGFDPIDTRDSVPS